MTIAFNLFLSVLSHSLEHKPREAWTLPTSLTASHIPGPQKTVFWMTNSQRGTKSCPSRRDPKRVWTSSTGKEKLVQKNWMAQPLTKFNFFSWYQPQNRWIINVLVLYLQASWPVILPSSATGCYYSFAWPSLSLVSLYSSRKDTGEKSWSPALPPLITGCVTLGKMWLLEFSSVR